MTDKVCRDTKAPELGKHGWQGALAPDGGVKNRYAPETFLVGVFEWVPVASGKGLKKGVAKVRITGWTNAPESVRLVANHVRDQLDAGAWTGPKAIDVTTGKWAVVADGMLAQGVRRDT